MKLIKPTSTDQGRSKSFDIDTLNYDTFLPYLGVNFWEIEEVDPNWNRSLKGRFIARNLSEVEKNFIVDIFNLHFDQFKDPIS